MLNSKEIPHFTENFTNSKKKSLLNLAKILQYKVSQTLPHFYNMFGKICRAKFKT